MWIKGWSTVIGANTAYMSVESGYTDIAISSWDDYAGGATVTGKRSGDFKLRAEIRSDPSQTETHSTLYTYTVIPDVVDSTAYIQNAATAKYVEIESASTSEGGIIQQCFFHTNDHMKWTFELGGNGYLKIKSIKSGKYIGVDSADTTKVKQYSTATDYTLWKFVETVSGNYKLICKATASSGKVLSVPSSTSGDYVDLTMLVYGDNSNYIDEWKIASSSLDVTLIVAVYDGNDRSSYFENIITDFEAIGCHNCYDNHFNNRNGVVKSELLQYMKSSKITLIRSHGGRTGVITTGGSLTTTDLSSLQSDYFSNSDLIIYAACQTAMGGETDTGNITNTTHAKGARTVIGFQNKVYTYGCNNWCSTFFEFYIAYSTMSGMTISNVLSITDQVMKNDPLYEGINSVSGEVITLANYVIVGEISFP